MVKNWRPITFLNISYKVLAKVIATRLVEILPKFINNTQTNFIKGRYILENLITSWEALEWAKNSKKNSPMLPLDFKKSYDRVELSFLRSFLLAFSFSSKFFGMVDTLLEDALAQIDVNGMLFEKFHLERSIRQGCPLAPSLFVIASDALFYLLRDNTFSPIIKGINLLDNNELVNVQFADETAIFLGLDEDNIESLMKKLDLFYQGSGATLFTSLLCGFSATTRSMTFKRE